MKLDVAERARALIGTRFQPQGRCGEGLDCVGLVLSACGLPADAVRRNYRLNGDHRAELEQGLRAYLRRVEAQKLRQGDVMLLQIADDQFHLAIRTDRGFVHAHAGIGRVVETPGDPEWAMIGAFRLRSRQQWGA